MENRIREIEPELLEKKPRKKRSPKKRFNFRLPVSIHNVHDYLRFFLFLVLIGLVYIWNAHLAEKQVIKEANLKKEISELRLEYISLQSTISAEKRYFTVAERVKELGLKPLDKAPYKLEQGDE